MAPITDIATTRREDAGGDSATETKRIADRDDRYIRCGLPTPLRLAFLGRRS
jgi:hypothetical protein